ncbi:endolytic transglycosylase MltG [Nonomuraea africana]|uniref:endolytic transglycosylase MltG n=1 Tax=Nonomuraea africana TaxID=46171 RepID=UPI0033FACDC0
MRPEGYSAAETGDEGPPGSEGAPEADGESAAGSEGEDEAGVEDEAADVIPFDRPADEEEQAAEDADTEAGAPGKSSSDDDQAHSRSRSLRRAGLLAAGAAASVLALGVAAFVVLKPYISPDDFEGAGTGAVTVRIVPGASAGDVGEVLADAGVVASARSFVNVAEERSKAGSLHPGHYRLRKRMAASAALDLLLSPHSRIVRRVTLPEGMRQTEALPHLAKQAGIPLKDFQAVKDTTLGLPGYARGAEGFLYPATYEVEPGTTAADLLRRMVSRYKQAAQAIELETRAAEVHLTPLEAVTVASLVQAEGGRDSDYPKIARVIYNRLKGGTPLQLDATVTYALGKRTLKVSVEDTKVRSPYNTYRHKGLPPGPIANPGEKALMAALYPAEGDWYWFVTTDPEHRITKFTDKESEFVRYREELNDYLGTH